MYTLLLLGSQNLAFEQLGRSLTVQKLSNSLQVRLSAFFLYIAVFRLKVQQYPGDTKELEWEFETN